MAEFQCKVADANGRVFSQIEAAESMSEVRQKLSDRGLFVYQVRPRESKITVRLRRLSVHRNACRGRRSCAAQGESSAAGHTGQLIRRIRVENLDQCIVCPYAQVVRRIIAKSQLFVQTG